MRGISEERLRYLFTGDCGFDLDAMLKNECQELNQWQPIESAPKDRKVLLYYLDRGIFSGKWDNDEYSKKPRPYWASEFSRLWGKNCARGEQPTHWQELPPSPELPEPLSGN